MDNREKKRVFENDFFRILFFLKIYFNTNFSTSINTALKRFLIIGGKIMKKTVACLLCLLVLLVSVPVFAGSSYYSGVILPRYKGDIELAEKSKTTDRDYYYSCLTYMGCDYDKINAWFEKPAGANVTAKYICDEGAGDVYMSGNIDLSINDKVVLNMENYTYSTVRVEVDGDYTYN